MNWLDRLERRFGLWAIPQFSLFIVAANGVIYLLGQQRSDFVDRLLLDPVAIRQGEVWRLITFLFIPPPLTWLGMAFWLYLLYQYSQALESEWGDFRFCVFYGIGALSTVIAAMGIVGQTLSNVYLNATLFLAFATLYPDYEFLLFFFLPVKVKYLAALAWVGFVVSFFMGSSVTRLAIVSSLINYFLFFGPSVWQGLKLKIRRIYNRKRFTGHDPNSK